LNFLLGAAAEALRANIDWQSAISLQRGQLDLKFQVEGVALTNHSSSQKTRLHYISYGIKSGQIFLPFCHKSRVWQTNRQTDDGEPYRD